MQLTYSSISTVQLTFLRLLSTRATQNFTYLCSRSVGWYDATGDNFDKAIKLQGANEEEFGYGTLMEPEVLLDECKVSSRPPFLRPGTPWHLPPSGRHLFDLSQMWRFAWWNKSWTYSWWILQRGKLAVSPCKSSPLKEKSEVGSETIP